MLNSVQSNKKRHPVIKWVLFLLLILFSIGCGFPFRSFLNPDHPAEPTGEPDLTLADGSQSPTQQVDSYQPSYEIQALAEQSGMTVNAREIFYAARPVIETDRSEFEQQCQTEITKNRVELGCYTSENRIFILLIDEPSLSSQMAVVAAHEMLHAAYAHLPVTDRTMINGLLNDVLPRVQNTDLNQRLNMYQNIEPGQINNELHAILGTEISALGIDLEQYYSLYFADDRRAVLTASNQFNQAFTQKEKEIEDLERQIKQLRQQMKSDLDQHRIAEYNQNVPVVNALIEQYNRTVRDYNTLSRTLIGEENLVNDQ